MIAIAPSPGDCARYGGTALVTAPIVTSRFKGK